MHPDPNSGIIYRIQICSASVSFLSSSFIACGIVKSDGGLLTSPYRRIIFGVSVSDILQSLSIIAGPFAVPSSSSVGLWAAGNYHTCQADGFLFGFAAGSTPMYMFGLCLYTALKIKGNMTDEVFTCKIEKVMHFSIILLNLSIHVFGLTTKTINSAIIGNICGFAAVPTGCRQHPDLFGECDQDIERYISTLLFISRIFIPFSCLFGIICCMGTICWHVIQKNKIFGRQQQLRGRRSRLLASHMGPMFELPIGESFASKCPSIDINGGLTKKEHDTC